MTWALPPQGLWLTKGIRVVKSELPGHGCTQCTQNFAPLTYLHTQFCWLDALNVQKLRDAVPKDFYIFSNPLSERKKAAGASNGCASDL